MSKAYSEEDVSRVLRVDIPVGRWGPVTSNPKYYPRPIAKKYREGKLKSTFSRGLKDSEIKRLQKSCGMKVSSPRKYTEKFEYEGWIYSVAAYLLDKVAGSLCQWRGEILSENEDAQMPCASRRGV